MGKLVKLLRSLVLVTLFVGMPLMLTPTRCFAASDEYSQGLEDGKAAAGKGASSWLYYGCFFGGAGVLASASIAPDVPDEPLIGKSPDYVEGFSKAYLKQRKKKNLTNSASGCAAGTAAYLLLLTLGSSSSD